MRWTVLALIGLCLPDSSLRALTQALWVFPGNGNNPVTDATARQALLNRASASGVTLLYVSVYSSTPNSNGRLMYDEAAISDLITKAHTVGARVYAAYGAPDWPGFGCNSNGFPLQRVAEVVAYNAASPSAKFDGVILDVEPPEPQSASAYQALLTQYQCIRDALPAEVGLSAAIRFFWDDVIEYPVGSGVTRPVYSHIIAMSLSNVVVMGYRDFAGPSDCSSDGLICLDQDEIASARNLGKLDLILAGLETSDPASTGISNKETFFEEGQGSLNTQAQTVVDHFGILSGLGGFAIHNYQNSYLSGASANWPQTNSSFPLEAHEVKVTTVLRSGNGPAHLQGEGVYGRTYHVETSMSPTSGSFVATASTTASATGVIDYQDSGATNTTRRFYRLSYP